MSSDDQVRKGEDHGLEALKKRLEATRAIPLDVPLIVAHERIRVQRNQVAKKVAQEKLNHIVAVAREKRQKIRAAAQAEDLSKAVESIRQENKTLKRELGKRHVAPPPSKEPPELEVAEDGPPDAAIA